MRLTNIRQLSVSLLVCVALLVGLVLVGANQQVLAADSSITVMMQDGPELQYIKDLSKEFTQETSIGVEFIPVGREVFLTRFSTQLMARSSAVDVVSMLSPVQLPQFAAAGVLEPLGDRLKERNDFLKVALDLSTVDGELYAVPHEISTMFLFYRKDLIENPPEDWDEYLEMAKKFTRSINPDSPTEYGTLMQALPPALPSDFFNYYTSIGDGPFDENGNVNWLSEGNKEAAQFYVDLLRKWHVVPPDVSSYEWGPVIDAFRQGLVAMGPQWNAAVGPLGDPEASPDVYDKIAVAPLPGKRLSDGSLKRSSFVQIWAFSINRYSHKKDAAWKFVEWMTSKKAAKQYVKAGGYFPRKSALLDDEILSERPSLSVLVEAVKTTEPEPTIPQWPMIRTVIAEEIGAALAGQKSVDQALQSLNKRTAAILGQ